MQMGNGPDGGSGDIVDAEKVVVGIEGEFIRIEGPLGHGRGGDESFGEGTGRREEGGGTKGGAAEKTATVTLGAIGNFHWVILRE